MNNKSRARQFGKYVLTVDRVDSYQIQPLVTLVGRRREVSWGAVTRHQWRGSSWRCTAGLSLCYRSRCGVTFEQEFSALSPGVVAGPGRAGAGQSSGSPSWRVSAKLQGITALSASTPVISAHNVDFSNKPDYEIKTTSADGIYLSA